MRETDRPSSVASGLRGRVFTATDEACLRAGIELALDYRGDVTVIRRSRPEPIEGYLFDRRAGAPLEESSIRIIPKDGSPRVSIPCSDIAELRITGKDTAEGKSFETWVRRYAEKKLAGEAADIESEPLEDG
jgi:hypothetical protein